MKKKMESEESYHDFLVRMSPGKNAQLSGYYYVIQIVGENGVWTNFRYLSSREDAIIAARQRLSHPDPTTRVMKVSKVLTEVKP